MKISKMLMLSTLALLPVGAVVFTAKANQVPEIYEVQATAKDITFDKDNHLPSGGAGEYGDGSSRYEYTTNIAGSDDIEVSAWSTNNAEGVNKSVTFGGSHFLTMGSEAYNSLIVKIGLNNITSLSIDYGTTKNYITYCYVEFFDEDDASIDHDQLRDQTSAEDEAVESKVYNVDVSSLSLAKTPRFARIKVRPWINTNVGANELYIHSITANWSC